ncbi:hypothetical protein ACQJBY_042029 [Aegilops geniculata]
MREGIRTKLMVKCNEKRIGGQNARWEITPTYSQKLEESKKWARNYKAQMAGPDLYQVQSGENVYAVNLVQMTCGCRRWDMTAIPCHHVVSAIYKSKQHPEDFVSAFFKKEMYMATYNPIIFPVPGPDLWTKTPTRDIDPPSFQEEEGEKADQEKKGEGHRYTNCGDALKPSLLMRKNKHQPNRKNQATASVAACSTASKPPAALKPPRSTTTSTRNTWQAAPTPKNKSQSASAARTSRSTPTTRAAGRAPYAAPRAAASHTAAGPSHGQKRKRKPTRWDDYFTASGNH